MTRILTALVLIPLILYVVLAGPPLLVFLVVAIVAGICYDEYRRIAAGYGIELMGLGFAAGFAMLAVPRDALLVVIALALVALALAMRAPNLETTLPRAAAMVFGVVYVFGSWKCAILLHGASPHWLMYALGINWTGDICA
ncbi:MAG: hypothetical protein ACRD96_28075, partial [Bryobacteraceae bacterium]